MSEEWLKYHYFKDKYGKSDSVVDSLGDCMAQITYVIGINQFNDPNFYKAFLNETTLIVKTEKNKMSYLGTEENVWKRDMVQFYVMNEKNHEEGTASEKISRLLKMKKPVIISPIVERLPFEVLYDPEYKSDEQKSEHFLGIISEDKENFYFIDNPALINRKNFISYEENNEIGIIRKKDFEFYSKGYCMVLTPIFKQDAIKKEIDNCEEVFKYSYEKYKKNTISENNFTTFYGITALKKLAELFETGDMRFCEEAPSHDRDLITYFRWRIWHIKGRRNLQIRYLKEVYGEKSIEVCKLTEALVESCKYWGMLNDNLYKDFLKGKSNADSKYVPIVEKIIEAENEMHEAYHDFLVTV